MATKTTKVMVCGVDVSVFSAYDADTLKNCEPKVVEKIDEWKNAKRDSRRRIARESQFKATAVKLAMAEILGELQGVELGAALAKHGVKKDTIAKLVDIVRKNPTRAKVCMALGVSKTTAGTIITLAEQEDSSLRAVTRAKGGGLHKDESAFGPMPVASAKAGTQEEKAQQLKNALL